MTGFNIRPAAKPDFKIIYELNLAAIKATGKMNADQLQQLHNCSEYHKVVIHKNKVVAFLLVLPPNQPYQSLNYQWFNSHYSSFWYVDRIVVDQKYTGLQIGGLLYQDLFSEAHHHKINSIACEYNIKPLNFASQKFHQRHGFIEVANQWLDGHQKKVSLQLAEVNSLNRQTTATNDG